jgi:oligoendopeptidase F
MTKMLNSAATADLGPMPEWNLADLYSAPDCPALAADLAWAEQEAKSFAACFQGKLAELTPDELGDAIAIYERLSERLYRVMAYASLRSSSDLCDPEIGKFNQTMQERVTEISSHSLFFTLEINRLSDAHMAMQMTSAKVAYYESWLRDLRAFKAHQLSDEAEKLLHERDVTGRSAWIRLFDETMAGLRFPLADQLLTSAEILHLMSDQDATQRKAAAKSFGAVLGQNVRLFALITNTLIKEKEIDDKWRCYPQPTAYRNLANQVEDKVVDALAMAVGAAQGRLSHRYYALKAKWFGVDALDYWDRNAPLPDDEDRSISWQQARDTVLSAYGAFSPRLAELGKRFFTGGWIDAPARAGKSPGAFAHPTVPSVHPYLLLNYMGRSRDVQTLAHELGHGVHQLLAAEQGLFRAETPLTLAETASVFGEMLTFRALLAAETRPERRRIMLAGKVEDMLNTVVRQIAFYEFERRLHLERRDGELMPERIGAIWLDVQRESLGPAIRFDDEYRYYWAYIPHFVHTPFYVYAYAFGDCLVNALFAVYQSGMAGFEQKYIDMLKAGGTLRHQELLAPFGLDASDPAFWSKGLDIIGGMIDELESLDYVREQEMPS